MGPPERYISISFVLLAISWCGSALAQKSGCSKNDTRIRLLAQGAESGCTALAHSYGLQGHELLIANAGLLDCQNLTAGQILCIPRNLRTDPAICTKVYRTPEGNATCEGLAAVSGYECFLVQFSCLCVQDADRTEDGGSVSECSAFPGKFETDHAPHRFYGGNLHVLLLITAK
jgi:hypothetical protein